MTASSYQVSVHTRTVQIRLGWQFVAICELWQFRRVSECRRGENGGRREVSGHSDLLRKLSFADLAGPLLFLGVKAGTGLRKPTDDQKTES